MSRRAVERTLGCPPGDYATRPCRVGAHFTNADWMLGAARWKDDGGLIEVLFDEGGRVDRARFIPVESAAEGPGEGH